MPNSSGFEIFRDDGNLYKRIRPRKLPILAACALLVLVLAANAWWLESTLTRPSMEEEIEDILKSQAMRDQSLKRLSTRIGEIEKGVDTLRSGDARLRKMIRLDKEANRATQAVGAGSEQSPDSQALMTRMEIQEAFVRALNRPAKLAAAAPAALTGALAQGPSPLGVAPDAWPVQGMISSDFGPRVSPFAGQEEFHKGVDIMAPAGSPVRAPAPGVVTFAGEDTEGSLAVVLDHGGGYVTTFSHLQRLEVTASERVQRGQDIGAVGQGGRSTGPHLHYEVHLHGVPVNPAVYLGSAAPPPGGGS
jgi:murein DD-endopeptidase MepM/ murein hydrolase activator NlpD